MRVFNLADDTPLPPESRGGAWLIGNFDGVHKGHQAMLGELKALHARVSVLTFDPHPRAFFGTAPRQLTALPEKVALLQDLGVDVLVVRKFDVSFAAHTAEAFIDHILKGQLGADLVAVGADFRFGAGRRGDTGLLKEHIAVHVFSPFCDESGQAYSSTRIRAALASGNVQEAEKLLGRGIKPAT